MYDFYSDTKTKPTQAMREAVLHCNVGDEQKGEDPTTAELCSRVAELLGKESAMFLPSGTMCNEIAIKVHTSPGDEIICEKSCHLINFETGGPAAISSVMINAIQGVRGAFEPHEVHSAIRPSSRYAPRSSLLCVEQTANMAGGAIWDLDQLNAVGKVAKDAGLATHMDGARLLNAVVESDISAAAFAESYDSVWIDFTKGLGAPVGAALAGSKEFIDAAWRVKQQIGGAMRQSGVIASMCLYALDNHVERLSEDHRLAKWLGDEFAALDRVETVLAVDTNIVIFDLTSDAPTAAELVSQLKSRGVFVGAFGERRIRVVTHLDVDQKGGEVLLAELIDVLGSHSKEAVKHG